jgi:hypothetical protein
MVCLIIWQLDACGIATVSLPEHGAPPTNGVSVLDVQHRWQMLALVTFESSVFAAFPAIIRKPWEALIRVTRFLNWINYLLERCRLSIRNVIDIKSTIVLELSLWSTVSNLWNTLVGSVLRLEEHDRCPVIREVPLYNISFENCL